MNGRFLIGVLSGAVLVSGAFVIGSVMFPTDDPKPPVEIANAPEAPEAVTAPAPVPAPEPVAAPAPEPAPAPVEPEPVVEPEPAPVVEPAPEPEPAPIPEPVSKPATAEPAPVAETAAPVEAAEAPASAEPAPTDETAAPVVAEAPPAEVEVAPDGTAATPAAEPAAASSPAPKVAEAPAEPPVAPAATELAAEAAPESPALAEATTPPEPPAALEPPPADAGEVPEAAAEAPAVIVEAPAVQPEATVEPALELAEMVPEPVVPAEAEPAVEAMPEAEPAPEAPEAAERTLPQVDGMVPEADEPMLPGTEVEPEAPEVGLLPDEAGADGAESTFESAPSLGETDGVIVGRLPKIGDAPVEEAPAADGTDAAEVAEAEPDTRPIVQFAAAFENPDAKPVMALVLIDPGTAEVDRMGLAALPFPVSFALDPMDPATPDRAAIYRAAGKEVVMLATGIAEGAQASDIEVAFQSMAQGLPEAVAVMDLADPLFQDQRPLASLVVPVVGAQGRGLLTWDRGLNAADQVARRDDVPSAVVFRDVGGTDSATIRRVLDRAVFKAGQDGRVAVAGTATPELVAALLEWTVEGRAATVALGPVTAVLTVE